MTISGPAAAVAARGVDGEPVLDGKAPTKAFPVLSYGEPAPPDIAAAMAELAALWPDLRALVDGFTVNSDWNNEWDAQVRQRMIDFGLRHLTAKNQLGPEWEIRADGVVVRKDRWEWAVRRVVALLWGNRKDFECDEVVEAVRSLVPCPHAEGDDESLTHAAQKNFGA